MRMRFSQPLGALTLGESIAVSGACLTVVEFSDHSFDAELSNETLDLTTLSSLETGDAVNLERAMLASDRLGGHLVSGHVDGVGQVTGLTSEGEMTRVTLELPPELAPYAAKKGSITVDGVSLTINEVGRSDLHLLLIPHTQSVTTLGRLKLGTRVNLEVDLLARYVERILAFRADS
jgi:riboflavin synthase